MSDPLNRWRGLHPWRWSRGYAVVKRFRGTGIDNPSKIWWARRRFREKAAYRLAKRLEAERDRQAQFDRERGVEPWGQYDIDVLPVREHPGRATVPRWS